MQSAHNDINEHVRRAYVINPEDDILEFLLKLNRELADKESRGDLIQGPGMLVSNPDPAMLVTNDCIREEERP